MKNLNNGTKLVLWGAAMLGSIVLSGVSGGNMGKALGEIIVNKKGKA